MSISQEQGADESTGSYSGQSPLALSLSLGYSMCSSINTVPSLNSSIMVVSAFFIPYLGLSEGHPPRSQQRKEERRKGGNEIQRY